MERYREEEAIKKGPWTPEEDEVLMKFVNKYGPKDWSSLRSMGLLPRTGKSCRLRWVNKLRPNLKIGCKFTAEEERVVIDLQARFGNRWATIASYLPGRTDNDVKNFWSTRQKRLARILQSPSPRNKFPKNKGKALLPLAVHQVSPLQVLEFNSQKMKEEPSSSLTCHSFSSPSMVGPEILPLMPLPDLLSPDLMINIDSALPSLIIPDNTDHTINSSTETALLPLLPDPQDYALDLFKTRQVDELENLSRLSFGSEFNLELMGSDSSERKCDEEKLETLPDSFFDELPADMFDCLV